MRNKINEVTDSYSDGQFQGKLNIAPRTWKKSELGPYQQEVSPFKNSGVSHDFYDGELKVSKNNVDRLESETKRKMKKNRKTEKENFQGGYSKRRFSRMVRN